MAGVAGRDIRFHDETDEEAFASRGAYGAPEWEVRGWVSTYWAIREGSLAHVSPHVRELSGHDPVSLEAFLTDHPEALG